MKFSRVGKAIAGSLIVLSASAVAEINLSGFASVNVGKVLNGDGVPHYDIEPTFLADYPNVSAYTEDWDWAPETLFGLQFQADLSEGLSVTTQIVARGADDFDPEFEWAYVSYEVNDEITIQAGKKRLPLFYYSDFFDVGYAYIWMRPAADNYTWQILNYNGANILYSTEIADWSVNTNVYIGKADDKENKLLGEFFYGGDQIREIWKDLIGGVASAQKDWFEVRLSAMTFTQERERNGEEFLFGEKKQRDGTFFGASFNFDFESIFVLTEMSQLELDGGKFHSYMGTVGYRYDDFTPFIAYSEFKTDNDPNDEMENHTTSSIGLRWDFHSSAALKVQWDKVDDKSYTYANAGDSEAITFGIDLIF